MYRKYIKRVLDFLFSGLLILALSPLCLFLSLMIRIKLGSPVIFIQDRPGKDEKIFRLYKFRTMMNQTDVNGNLLSDAQRMTRFGALIRKLSIDEMPQLINIFKGDMSFIGPRPLLVKYLPYYTPLEKERHSVRPGLSGLAQVNGRNNLLWEDRFKLDVEYGKTVTFVGDVEIFIKTILAVLAKKDIVEPGVITDFDEHRRIDLEHSANLN